MKPWRNILMMCVAMLAITSCSSDNDSDTYEATELEGTWKKVHDKGVADTGTVLYTFHPQSANDGIVSIFSSDWAAGDATIYCTYTVTDAGQLQISTKSDDTSKPRTIVQCNIRRLTGTQMVWNEPDSDEEIAKFKKVK